MSAATELGKPHQAPRPLVDQFIAGNALDRAASAFTDAAACVRAGDLDKARRLAAEADGYLGLAEWALNGLRYVPHIPSSRRGADRAGPAVSADADSGDGASSPAGPAAR